MELKVLEQEDKQGWSTMYHILYITRLKLNKNYVPVNAYILALLIYEQALMMQFSCDKLWECLQYLGVPLHLH